MNEVIKDIKRTIKPNNTIIVGTSGGPDSMCLLDILINMKNKYQIICAHVNHNLRKESKKEAKMVKKYCEKNKIKFELYEIKKYEGNIENHARVQRYKFFEKLIKKYNAKYLLTAHHGDDLIETILMRIARGTDIKGLKGFTRITDRKNYQIYRPLIFITKEEILKYLKEHDITYALDKTNEDDKYTRNRFRKYILPHLKKENKNIHKNFIKLSNSIKEYEDHLNGEKEKIIKSIYSENIINLRQLKKEDKLMRQAIIYSILDITYKDSINLIKEKHIEGILKAIDNEKPNITVSLPSNKEFVKLYNEATIMENKKSKEYDYILTGELELPNNHTIKWIDDTKETSNNVIKLSSEEVSIPFHVRTRKKGDKMEIKGLNGRKKIKDIFIDSKIPAKERTLYPILTDSKGNIIWLPGLKKSKFDKSKTKNYDIIIKYF